MIETLTTPRRHPLSVSTDSSIASAAEDYVPPAELDSGLIKGHPWGRRTVHLRSAGVQFMVYDALGRNVLSTAPTPELAAYMATRRLEREALPPSVYWPVLEGCTFSSRASEKAVFLVHQVLDEEGRMLGESDLGREDAAKAAATMRLSQMDRRRITFPEFELITVPVAVSVGSYGRNSLGAVFANGEPGRAELRKLLLSIWNADPNAQALEPDCRKFIQQREVDFLKAAGKGNAAVCEVDVPFCEGTRSVKVLLHEERLRARAVMLVVFNQCHQVDDDAVQPHRYERQGG